MKKFAFPIFLILAVLVLGAFGSHKFYVSIYQLNFVPEKKMLQITSRIFIDDMNDALEKKHKRKFHLGEKEETANDVLQMQQYLSDHFTIKIDGKPKPFVYLSKEMESNVLICYFKIADIQKINSLEITNKILYDLVTEQQNIIQTTINGKKSSLLLTADNPKGIINN